MHIFLIAHREGTLKNGNYCYQAHIKNQYKREYQIDYCTKMIEFTV